MHASCWRKPDCGSCPPLLQWFRDGGANNTVVVVWEMCTIVSDVTSDEKLGSGMNRKEAYTYVVILSDLHRELAPSGNADDYVNTSTDLISIGAHAFLLCSQWRQLCWKVWYSAQNSDKTDLPGLSRRVRNDLKVKGWFQAIRRPWSKIKKAWMQMTLRRTNAECYNTMKHHFIKFSSRPATAVNEAILVEL